MGVSRCSNCDEKIKYGQILVSCLNFWLIECKRCEKKQSARISSRFIISVLSFGLPIFINRYLVPIFHWYTFLLYLAWLVIITLVSPFILRYQ